MDAPVSAPVEPAGGPFDALRTEAQAAVGQAANTLRLVREQYREAFANELERFHAMRDEVRAAERPETHVDALRLASLRASFDTLGGDRVEHQAELARIEIALRHLESTWLFLERGDESLAADASTPTSATDLQMRIVQAQEGERARLAQEIHDGPAQALSNAIFQVEFVERMIDRDTDVARAELRYLRDLLRRELGDVRGFISHLRPPLLDAVGLDGALRETVETAAALTGMTTHADLTAPPDALDDAAQTVVLRVAQEALHNVRKHAAATAATVTTRIDDGAWVLEVTDDGRGFDPHAGAARGRRNFGLQFMRERAELIGAAFEVRPGHGGGTIVRLAVPIGGERSR